MDKYMTTEELAQRHRTAPSTVRYWRMNGVGPTGVRIGRRVLYDISEVERWEAEQLAKAKA
jgi:DNA-binding transcriptional MerR regulator